MGTFFLPEAAGKFTSYTYDNNDHFNVRGFFHFHLFFRPKLLTTCQCVAVTGSTLTSATRRSMDGSGHIHPNPENMGSSQRPMPGHQPWPAYRKNEEELQELWIIPRPFCYVSIATGKSFDCDTYIPWKRGWRRRKGIKNIIVNWIKL